MAHQITIEQLHREQDARLAELRAELAALEGVTINTSHKTLTNRAIAGNGARIGDYIGINKALFVSYTVEYPDGSRKYSSRDITAYSYTTPEGVEIGSEGGLRTSRTFTPAELAELVASVCESIRASIKTIEGERKNAAKLVKRHNDLSAAIAAHNDGISHGSNLARIS